MVSICTYDQTRRAVGHAVAKGCRLRSFVKLSLVPDKSTLRLALISVMSPTIVKSSSLPLLPCHCTEQPELICFSDSHCNLRPLLHISSKSLPKSYGRSRQVPRLQAQHPLGNMGVSRRRHRISRFRGLWSDTALPMARSPPSSLRSHPEHHG